MRLLADCGNSAIKLALAHDGGIWSHARLAPEPSALSGFAQEHLAAIDELVVLPGSAANADVIARWWADAAGVKPLRTIGREVAVPGLGQYPGMGLDRVVAGLVAARQEGRPVVVVDAGTATTLAAWAIQAPVCPTTLPRFLGGLIAPGARACSVGLSSLAPALPSVEPLPPGASARQHDTRGALAGALAIGHPAMIAACLARLRQETGIETAVITGGNAGALIDAGVLPRLAYRPTLVLEGIEEMCRREQP